MRLEELLPDRTLPQLPQEPTASPLANLRQELARSLAWLIMRRHRHDQQTESEHVQRQVLPAKGPPQE